jgi:TonB family protein
MSEAIQRSQDNVSAGHLSVHLDSSQPPGVLFSFEQPQKRIAPAAVASFCWHVAVGVVLFVAWRFGGQAATVTQVVPPTNPNQIIWLNQVGPGGGGGGGGNQMKEPPRKAETPGKDKITVPVEKPPSIEPPKIVKNDPNPVVEQLNIPAKALADSTEFLPGAIDAPTGPPTLSQGPGKGGGAGTGTGSGIGPGTGSGLGPGSGGGTGGGVYQPGNGVTTPRLLHEEKPQYTSEAMRAKVQGTVWVSCVVQTDGTVGDVTVIRSLDPTFGLDQEAVKAARKWRFEPGRRLGQAVPVLITIELQFTLR